jgi:cation diffusion facilitator family transporter
MHSDSLAPWQKRHSFLAEQHGLLADRWHMGSHAAALGIAAFAYAYAHRHAENSIYTFGTGKVGDLVAFSSAVLLLVIAGLMAFESAQRPIAPVTITFTDALIIAVIGLIVNLVSAWLLKEDHGHKHTHDHSGDHDHHHHDHNLRAAYVHVLTDALTSVLAIVALAAGMIWGLNWLDPAMGIVGAAIIVHWAWGLMVTTGGVLLDAAPSGDISDAVRNAIEAEPDNRIADLHLWRVGPEHLAAVLTVVTHQARTPAHYKILLAGVPCLSHVTVEVERYCDMKPHAA